MNARARRIYREVIHHGAEISLRRGLGLHRD